jgi:integrase
MARIWKSTKYPGIRYREHPNRKCDGHSDRYYVIRYNRAGKTIEEPVGWSSGEGVNTEKANKIRTEIKANIREGKKPQSLKEKREIEDARRQAEALQKELDAGARITFESLAQKFLEWSKLNRKSYPQDESRWRNHIESEIGHLQVQEVSNFHIDKLKNRLIKKGLSEQTIVHCLALLRAILNKGVFWDLIERLPVHVKLKKPDNHRTRYLTHKEAHALLRELAQSSPQWHDISFLALHSGLRAGEIFGLTCRDLNFINGIMTIRNTKNGKTRPAYMTMQVKAMLKIRKEQADGTNGYVFLSRKSQKIREVSHTFDRAVETLGLNAGVAAGNRKQKIVFHSLRHTFCSWLAITGEPLVVIKELAGHSRISQTEQYAHLSEGRKQEAIKSFSARFDEGRDNVVNLAESRKGS